MKIYLYDKFCNYCYIYKCVIFYYTKSPHMRMNTFQQDQRAECIYWFCVVYYHDQRYPLMGNEGYLPVVIT